MRVPAFMVAAALVLAACGEKKVEEGTVPPAADPAMAATTGTTYTVNMVESKFDPATLTVKTGDTIVFKGVSGGPHNVQFATDSLSPAAVAAIDAGIADKAMSLTSNMAMDGTDITVSFKDVPAGTYVINCQPHMANGMKMTVTVTQ